MGEHLGSDPMLKDLIDEILKDAGELCRHSFAHHIMECVLEHGLPDQKHRIAFAIYEDLMQNATDPHATYVIESALKHCHATDSNTLVAALVCDQETLLCLAEHQSGLYVVKALIRHTQQATMIRGLLQQASTRIRASPHGRQLLTL